MKKFQSFQITREIERRQNTHKSDEVQEAFDEFPPEPPMGSRLQFAIQYNPGGQVYTYLALRTEVGWSLTGKNPNPISWFELVGKWVQYDVAPFQVKGLMSHNTLTSPSYWQ